MSDLSNSSYRLYTLLLFRIVRKRSSREPTEKTNPFLLKYRDFKTFGIPRASFTRDIKELIDKKYIEVSGTREQRMCKITKW